MKRSVLALVFLVGFVLATYSQDPSQPVRRRGLDQIDLLTMRSPAESPVVNISLSAFKLLGPLIDHSKQLENSFASYRAGKLDIPRNGFYDHFGEKTVAIYRSIYLIKEMEDLSPPAQGVIDQNVGLAKDIGRVAAVIRFGDAGTFKKEIANLYERHTILETGDYNVDLPELIAAMLAKVNANFARFRVAP